MAADYDPNQQVDLVAVAEILNEHLDGALVRSAYEKLRTTERERTWTLNHMMAFWVAVTLRAPPSLGQALREAAGSPTSSYPHVTTSPQAFFQRSSSMRWEFFAEVFRAFTQSIREAESPRFAHHQRDTAKHFENILVLDGSNLDPVARRLKILWKDMSTPIPGAMFACYDLRRGALADLWYAPTLRRGELTLAREALGQLPAGALLLGDRLYGTPKFLSEVQESGRWGVFRKQSQVKCRSEKLLGRYESDGAVLEDWEVELGKAAGLPARLIRLRRGEKTYEYVTNVLDPEVLSAEAIAELYRDRWQVERMFQDLKTVLNLKCFYCGNTNAVAMQIYAAAIVYCALRIGQGRIAYEASIEPEAISTPKLFPLLAATAATLTTLEYGFFRTEFENPEVKLRKPDWRTACRLRTKLKDILADKTRGKRPRDKRSNAPRRPQWREIPPPPGSP